MLVVNVAALLRKHGGQTGEELKAEGKLEQANNRDRSD
jgi:hypothetical protein